jgi:hypothetical protein
MFAQPASSVKNITSLENNELPDLKSDDAGVRVFAPDSDEFSGRVFDENLLRSTSGFS